MSSVLMGSGSDDYLDFDFRVGMDVLTEFVASHTPADVLRELVQNEYDAGGTKLEVEFGPDALIVRGNGTVIDGRGWQRLSVMLGTGVVAGGTDRVEPKTNGIGSKNFGMRSLFLFGDRIEVESGGSRTILDRSRGTLRKPVRHPASAGKPGVTVRVPYRQVGDETLRAFDEENESEALKSIVTELAPTVIKLAQPDSRKSLQTVVLRSSRLGQELQWRQSVGRDQSARDVLRRGVRLKQNGVPLAGITDTIREIEYQQSVRPPDNLRRPDIPGYFKISGGYIRLGMSFRTRTRRGNGLDLDSTGIFYYPIGAARSRTGFPFSISAPFQMTEDRSQLRDPQTSEWNSWLIEQAAQFAVRVLRERLYPAFGPDSYLAFDIRSAGASTVGLLVEEIERLLRTEHCWPSEARRRGKPVYAAASSLNFVANPALADIAGELPQQDLLRADLAALPDIQSLISKLGSKTFTIGSLIQLRCAGAEDRGLLKTRLDPNTEASYSYDEFPAPLLAPELQQKFAGTIDACRSDLKPDHRIDLRKSPTTLTEAETLSSPEAPLWIVPEALIGVIPKDRTLHRGLTDYKVLTGLCMPFRPSAWAIDTAAKIQAGTSSDQEREALAQYLRGEPSLSAQAWAAVRLAPVLQDQDGEWVAPADMVSRSARGASVLSPALHLPTTADERNVSLRRLRFRSAVRGTDVVALARLVEQDAAAPAAMRSAVKELPRLLTRTVISQLKGIRFLETTSGSVLAPAEVYVRSDRLIQVIGEDAPYAAGWPEKALKTLGCRSEPRADDIVEYLTLLGESGEKPARPILVYEALVTALKQERRPTDLFQHQDILWTGNAWEAADDCLVGEENRRVFIAGVAVLPQTWRNFGVALGVHTQPTDSHWQRLLVALSESSDDQPVTRRVASALRSAYQQLDHVPEGLPADTRFLLDDQGRLHSVRTASSGRFLLNDDPALAKVARAADAPVAFADTTDPRVRRFYERAGVKWLSSEATLTVVEHGSLVTSDTTVNTTTVLSRLRDPNFASAVAALVAAISGAHESRAPSYLAARLAQIQRLDLADGIQLHYSLAGTMLTVQTDYDVQQDRIIINWQSSPHELRRSVANAIAVIADPGSLGEQVLGDPVYFLLRCRSARELQRELERRKIAWRPAQALSGDFAEEPEEEQKIEETEAIADAISQAVFRTALSGATNSSNSPSPAWPETREPPEPSLPKPLPDLNRVRPIHAENTRRPSQPGSSGGGGGGGSGPWTPRTEQERENDRALGRRGEEIIFAIEQERVRQRGLPADRVVWVAATSPAADHDIKSVDDDGEDLFIEVKSTTGRNGRFVWPVAEFQLAIRQQKHYMLYRVYEADSETPSWSCFRNPLSLLESGALYLDINRLTGDLGPLT